MSRRSPYSERYKKNTKPKGTTKKSAASAKPKRELGEGAPKTKKKTAKAAKNKTPLKYQMPISPEFKLARKRWWIVLLTSMVILVASLLMTWEKTVALIPVNPKTLQLISVYMTFAALGLVALAWWIDLKQMRPMIKAFQAGIALEEFQKQEKKNKGKKKKQKSKPTDVQSEADDEAKNTLAKKSKAKKNKGKNDKNTKGNSTDQTETRE